MAALPADPDTIMAYLIEHAGKVRVSTLQRRLSAIREAHLYRGIKLDTSSAAFRDVWRGIRRTHGVPANKKVPLLTAGLRQRSRPSRTHWRCRRDRAMLLIGFGAALRRSELAGLGRRAAGRGRRLVRKPLMALQSTWAPRKPTRPARGT